VSLTEDDYPFQPYPGFNDPADWREIKGDGEDIGTPHDRKRGWVLIDDVLLEHDVKHARHDHPWCQACTQRFGDHQCRQEGYEPGPDPLAARQHLRQQLGEIRERTGQSIDIDTPHKITSKLAVSRSNLGEVDQAEVQRIATALGVDFDVVDAYADFTLAIDNWEYEATERKSTCYRRALRYLVLHRNPPLDTYDPTAEVETDDDEYLDRDQLRDLPVPEPLIDGILNRYSYVLLIGRDHTYKTFTALDWALCLATGKQWQGQAVEQARVLYIAGEGAYGLAKRIDAWEYAWGRKVPADRFTVRTSAVNLYRGGPALERLLERLSEGEYDLTVVDTLRRASGGANGNDTDMGLVVDNLERIKRATDTGSVLVIAHTDKGDNDARGFSGIEDDADIVWHAKADDAGNLTLKNTKQKDQAEHHDLQLHMAPALDSLVIEAASAADTVSTESEAALLVTMREMFSQTGATSTELLEATGMAKSTYYRARNKCLSNGLITNSGTKSRPRYELAQSHTGPDDPHVPDLRLSHESHGVSPEPRDSPTSPAPLIGRDVGIGTGRPTGQVAS
jgi:hypothetical protein